MMSDSEKKIESKVARINGRRHQPIDPQITIHDALNRYTKKELDEVRKHYELANVSQLSKAQLVDHIVDYKFVMTHSVLLNLTTEQYAVLEKAAREGMVAIEEVGEYHIGWWQRTTFLVPGTVHGKFVLVMPIELRDEVQFYSRQQPVKEKSRSNDAILTITNGLLNTFGVLNSSSLYMYLQKYDVVTGPNEQIHVRELLWRQQDYQQEVIVHGTLYASPGAWKPYALYDKIAERADIQPVELTKQQVVARASYDYIVSLEPYKKLGRFLKKEGKLSEDDVNELLFEIHYLLDNGAGPGQLITLINDQVIFSSTEAVNSTMQLVMDAANATPQWLLKGHTPDELFNEEKKHLQPLPKTPLVGRNELCPCGSGKKYKKCCLN